MVSESTKSAIFLSSLILNAILIVGVLWFAGTSRQRALDLDVKHAEEQIWLLEGIADELKSNEPDRIEKALALIEDNLALEKNVIYKIETR